MATATSPLTLTPIGTIRTGVTVKFNSRHQPAGDGNAKNIIELNRHQNFEFATRDLAGFSHIWLLWWFDRNATWRPVVMPPRGPAQRRGVFATRSPHRPNPIGMTAVPLLEIDGLNLLVGDVDLLDGTPILDIKPYLTTVDCIPEAALGWVGEVEEQEGKASPYTVETSDHARSQLEWLRTKWGIEFIDRAIEILLQDPSPHRTRRIRRLADGRFQMGCGTWRLLFSILDREIVIESIASGYPETLVMGDRSDFVLEQEAHIEFLQTWRW